eukprot:608890-Rhodomonas_salina.1
MKDSGLQNNLHPEDMAVVLAGMHKGGVFKVHNLLVGVCGESRETLGTETLAQRAEAAAGRPSTSDPQSWRRTRPGRARPTGALAPESSHLPTCPSETKTSCFGRNN